MTIQHIEWKLKLLTKKVGGNLIYGFVSRYGGKSHVGILCEYPLLCIEFGHTYGLFNALCEPHKDRSVVYWPNYEI